MRAVHKSLLLAGLHLAIVCSLFAKFALDRASRPRFWLMTAPVDPYLPVRGRYVALAVEVPLGGVPPAGAEAGQVVEVKLRPGPAGLEAIVLPGSGRRGEGRVSGLLQRSGPGSSWSVRLRENLAFFLPEHGPDPSRRAAGEDLWVEVTLPARGPLRPIRLALVKNGVWSEPSS